jgi:multiple sugar transport system substrate-binding protein
MIFMWGSTGRGSPAREAAYQSWMDSPVASDHAKVFLNALKTYMITGRPYKTTAGPEVMDIVVRYTDLISSGDMSVEDAVAAIERESLPIMAKATVMSQATPKK